MAGLSRLISPSRDNEMDPNPMGTHKISTSGEDNYLLIEAENGNRYLPINFCRDGCGYEYYSTTPPCPAHLIYIIY